MKKFNVSKFAEALTQLQNQFPECYIEAWTPEDFGTVSKPDESRDIVSNLECNFDANVGTNWDSLRAAGGRDIWEGE